MIKFKSKLKYVFILLALAVAFIAGCSSSKMVYEIYGCEDIPRTPAKIHVKYDDDSYIGEFEITDKETIAEISDIIFNDIEFYVTSEQYDGGNISIYFIDESGHSYHVPFKTRTQNLPKGSYYMARDIVPGSKSKLWSMFYRIGKEQGALTPR